MSVHGHHSNQTPIKPAPTRTRARALFTAGSAVKSSRSKRQTDANVNPFTPTGMLLTSKKRTRSERKLNGSSLNSFDEGYASEESDEEVPLKRIALHQTDVARYHKEFHQVSLLGKGQFGSVHKCINRLDGCVYAVKKSQTPVAGSPKEFSAMNEVSAHAVLGQPTSPGRSVLVGTARASRANDPSGSDPATLGLRPYSASGLSRQRSQERRPTQSRTERPTTQKPTTDWETWRSRSSTSAPASFGVHVEFGFHSRNTELVFDCCCQLDLLTEFSNCARSPLLDWRMKFQYHEFYCLYFMILRIFYC